MTRFTGLIPPICTPLDAAGGVDTESLRSLVEFQIDAGANGLFILGSSGEAIYLDDDERLLVARTAKAAVAGRVPLLVGALAPSPRRVRQQLELLEDVGADAFVVTAPFYAQLSDGEVEQHFRSAAAAAGAPVLAYDIPGNVGARIPERAAEVLLHDGTLAGLKDSSGDVDAFSELLKKLGPGRDAVLLSGSDTQAWRMIKEGADGLIPGLANVRPQLFTGLLRAAASGDDQAGGSHQAAIAILNGIFQVGTRFGLGRHASEIGALKHILRSEAVIRDAAPAWPLTALPEEAAVEVDRIVAAADERVRQATEQPSKANEENHD